MTQKFFVGDLVYVAEDLGISMAHFESGQKAIVQFSYADQYGDSSNHGDKEFSLYLLKAKRSVAWYHEHQLSLIEPDRFDLLPDSSIIKRNHIAKMNRNKEL